MNKTEAWNKFKASGKVEDYLEYAKTKKGEENDNESRGNNRS